ncbi:MAG: hypothetical protein LJF04_14555, partial [Gemmatimonadetes bacterium]|nr:hypothetical protein [Gemmatimonadota bacterium]
VNFRVIRGGGSVFAGSAETDDRGIAQEYWALGIDPGENVLEVRAVNPTTGEKEVYAEFSATGLPGAEDLTALSELFSHTWVLALTDRIQSNHNGVGTALKANFQRIVDALHPGGVLAEVDRALTSVEAILGQPRDFNPVEFAFLGHVSRFCRERFDEVMQSIPPM